MLSEEAIEQAQMECAAPIVLELKTDGLLPFPVDYRKLNAVAKRDFYPTPHLRECINPPGRVALFFNLRLE